MTAKRDKAAARSFLERAINLHGVPEKITIDKSGANTAAVKSVKADARIDILMRQCIFQPIVDSLALQPLQIGIPRSIHFWMRGYPDLPNEWSQRTKGLNLLNNLGHTPKSFVQKRERLNKHETLPVDKPEQAATRAVL